MIPSLKRSTLSRSVRFVMFALAIAALSLSACGDDDDATSGRLDVVATIAPTGALTKAVGGDLINLTILAGAMISGASMQIYGANNAGLADGAQGIALLGRAQSATIMFPNPVSDFGAYWGSMETDSSLISFTFLDADGVKHFTDVPDDARYRMLILSPHALTMSGEHYNAKLLARAAEFDAIIEHAALSAAVEPNLLRAVIVVESGFNSRAVSKRGAVGLMQLLPATASRFGADDRYDPRQNVHAGALYLKFLMDRFGHNMRLALAAYNAGEDAVARNGGRIPPYTETMAYVPKVLKVYRMLADRPRAT